MSVRRSIMLLTLLMFGVPVFVFGGPASQTDAEAAQSLQTYTVQRSDVFVDVSAVGSIDSVQAIRLNFTTAGRVNEVLVQPSDYVVAGDVLVRLEGESSQIAYEQAEIALSLAEIQLAKLSEPVSEDQVEIAQANLDSAWGAYTSLQNSVSSEDIRAAELRYQQALEAQRAAEAQRTEPLYDDRQASIDLREAQIGAASFNTEIVRLQLESLQQGAGNAELGAAYARVIQAQRELERVQVGPQPTEIERAEIAVAQAELRLERAATDVAALELTAPFDGVVAAVNAEMGSVVGQGIPVVEMVDVSTLTLTVNVDEIDIRQIAEGMSAKVSLDALPSVELPAVIDQIALIGQNEGGIVSYDVRVLLNESDPRVRVGMTAEASIVVEERRDTLVVPNFYIRLDRRTGKAFVNTLDDDGEVQEVEIVLGLQGRDSSEVLSGLEVGDVIVVDLAGDRFSLFGS